MTKRIKQGLKDGDIIDINDTVNGQSEFIIFSLKEKDARYLNDISRKYEYDFIDLISESLDEEIIVIGNLQEIIDIRFYSE